MRLHSFALLARHNFLAMAIFWTIFQSAGSPNQWDQICWCVLFVRRNLPQKLILWSTSQATTPRLRIWRHQRCRPAWLFRWCAVNATIGLARDGIWKNTWTRRTQNLVLIVSWCSEIPLPTRYNATISFFQQHDDADQPGPLEIFPHVHILWLLWGWKASPGAQKGRNLILTNKQTNKQTNNNTTHGISGTHIHLCWLRGHFRDQQHPGETHRRQPPRQVWSMPGRVQVISSFVKSYLNLSISWPDADHCCYFTRRSMAPLTSRVTKQVLTSWSKFPLNLAWVDYSLFCKPSNFHFHFFIHKISFVQGWGWGL